LTIGIETDFRVPWVKSLNVQSARGKAHDGIEGFATNEGQRGDILSRVSIVLPAKNECAALNDLLPRLASAQPQAEIIVVDDGSVDGTVELCSELGIRCLSAPYSMGNGAAIKRGARAAQGEILVFMDGDGQHDPLDVARLLSRLEHGYDMVVGARDWGSQAGVGRGVANTFYNWLATRMTGHQVSDLTSGFRAVRAEKFREFLHLLPNGFSYPTTSTMAFFRSAYAVAYEPIKASARIGKSHIRPLRDGVRFLLIIFKIATLYSPLKLFLPASALFFTLGCANYVWTFVRDGRLTNMSTLMWSAAVIVFLIGLVSEQITSLTYRRND
jgi:glycosyltransferase involved in cell wall biosynthesis